jgi:hypothetical protein
MLPNFLIIGAARSGTSTLYRFLQQHPEIYLRPDKRPEPHFFFKATEYAKGIRYYEERWFPAKGAWRAVGEASTSYLFGAEVPARIAQHLPGIRLISVLRNPIDRAFSGYWHSVRSGIEKLDFAAAIEHEVERTQAAERTPLGELKPYSYVARGFYHAQLANYLEVFDSSQMLVLMFDELCAAPAVTLNKVYRFLGVAPDIFPSRLDLVENRSVPDGKTIDLTLRKRLATVYEDDVARLGTLLGRDLSSWLE